MNRIRYAPHSDVEVDVLPGKSGVTLHSEGTADQAFVPPRRGGAAVTIPWHEVWLRSNNGRRPVFADGRLLEEAK